MASGIEYIGPNTMLCVPIQYYSAMCVLHRISFLVICVIFSLHCYTPVTDATTAATTVMYSSSVCGCVCLSNNRQVFLPELSLRSIITYNKLLLFGTLPLSLSIVRRHRRISPSFFICYLRKKKTFCRSVSVISFIKQQILTIYFSLRFR